MQKGLDWIIERTSTFFRQKSIHPAEKISANQLTGLPFSKGSSELLIISATLFLASVFGRMDDHEILKIYDWLQEKGSKKSGRWCGWSSYSNILRAFVVQPYYAESEAVTSAIKNLHRVQKESGIWAGAVPFYQTVNALAHLDSAEVDAQLVLAFKHLYNTQRRDGTWGISQPEWNNFLIVHALKNKGEL